MSTNISNFNRYSICATCLSQDRKLFNVRDSRACIMSYSELYLQLMDRICWECHRMVQKIVAFKNQAQKAQAELRNMRNTQQSEIQCLSSLTTSLGRSVDVIPSTPTYGGPSLLLLPLSIKPEPPEPPEPAEVTIKEEEVNIDLDIKEEQEGDNNTVINDGGNDNYDGNDSTKDKYDFNDHTKGNYDGDENTIEKDGREMSVFTHKKVWPAKKPVPGGKKNCKRKADSSPPLEQPDYIYTETTLSEEEMREWWQRKPTTDYYTVGNPRAKCDKCVEPFDYKKLVEAHAKRHTKTYGELECDICRQRSVDEQALTYHRKLHYRLLKCRYCPLVWDNANTMRRHCSDMHSIPQVLWDCDQCERQFSCLGKLRAHQRCHRCAKCPDCGKNFGVESIKNHMLLHTGGMPLRVCSECGGQYRGVMGLRAHMLTHRNKVDVDAYCTECNMQFKTMLIYKNHLKSKKHVREEEFEYKCEVCGKRFPNRFSLDNHMDVHSDTPFPCDRCDQAFNTRRTRTRHVRTVHEGRPQHKSESICDYCGKSFKSKVILSEHINTHTGARPHVCQICGDTFGYKSALYLHGRFKHKIPKKPKKYDNVNKDSKE